MPAGDRELKVPYLFSGGYTETPMVSLTTEGRFSMASAVIERIERSRGELAEGKLGAAVGGLGDMVTATRDPELLGQMRELAQEGLERAGRFSKGVWRRLLADIEEQLAKVSAEVRG
jgi:hypothetical protein